MNATLKQQVNDIKKAGFNLELFSSIKDQKSFLNKAKNKKKNWEIIGIVDEEMLNEVVAHFEKNVGLYQKIIVYTKNEDV